MEIELHNSSTEPLRHLFSLHMVSNNILYEGVLVVIHPTTWQNKLAKFVHAVEKVILGISTTAGASTTIPKKYHTNENIC